MVYVPIFDRISGAIQLRLKKKKKKKNGTSIDIMNIKRETNIKQVFRVESNDKLQQQGNQ